MNLLNLKTYFFTAFLAICPLLFMSSCKDSFIYEDEGDCTVRYKIRFVYDMNLKWADAFPSEVKSVNLYVFDSNKRFYTQYEEAGEILSDPAYRLYLDLPAGDYYFVSWCGLENDGIMEESFTVTAPVAGVTTLDELICSLNTTTATKADAMEISDTRLNFLYHGYLEANLPDSNDGEEYEYVINLTKDTNHIRIILQELASDEDMDPADYAITIESADGVMAYNNDLLGNNVITYRPWSLMNDYVGVGRVDVDNGEITYVKGLVADLSTSRMMAYQKDNFMLTVTRTDTGEQIIARVPVIQYALLSRSYYELAYGHLMTDQEFLDREDEYVLTFFLEKGKWISSYIDILQWRIVIGNYDVG